MIGWGGLVGWLFGCGAAAVVAYDGPWRAVRLHQRIRAAVHDADVRVRVASGPLHLLGATRVRAIETRQLHAGEAPDAAAHVLRSLISAVAGLAVGTVVIAVLRDLPRPPDDTVLPLMPLARLVLIRPVHHPAMPPRE